ncbi:MAG: HDOD domain-containing protein [Myxococcales bacterium]|nr:HDOD domain-containing protein [Myxococcales bacterium]
MSAAAEPAAGDGVPPCLLFVDDEQAVLDGLRDLLRRERRAWRVVFALGPERALAELAAGTFDVVVADMRMPGMDGAELLELVRGKYPATTRIVLSGHADRGAVLRVMPVAHQYLQKPCDAEVLRSTLGRALALRSLLQSRAIRDLVGGLKALPSLSDSYAALQRAAADESATGGDLARIVERDPAMCAKVLQLANSACLGASRRVTSVRHAVTFLGTELLKALAVSTSVFSALERCAHGAREARRIQERALVAAAACVEILPAGAARDTAVAAALLHGVGEVLLGLVAPEEYAHIVASCAASGTAPHELERGAFGASHAEAGAYLLGMWGLPHDIVEAVAFHHAPDTLRRGEQAACMALHLADAFAHAVCEGARDEAPTERCDGAFLERAGLVAEVGVWWRRVVERAAVLRAADTVTPRS